MIMSFVHWLFLKHVVNVILQYVFNLHTGGKYDRTNFNAVQNRVFATHAPWRPICCTVWGSEVWWCEVHSQWKGFLAYDGCVSTDIRTLKGRQIPVCGAYAWDAVYPQRCTIGWNAVCHVGMLLIPTGCTSLMVSVATLHLNLNLNVINGLGSIIPIVSDSFVCGYHPERQATIKISCRWMLHWFPSVIYTTST